MLKHLDGGPAMADPSNISPYGTVQRQHEAKTSKQGIGAPDWGGPHSLEGAPQKGGAPSEGETHSTKEAQNNTKLFPHCAYLCSLLQTA